MSEDRRGYYVCRLYDPAHHGGRVAVRACSGCERDVAVTLAVLEERQLVVRVGLGIEIQIVCDDCSEHVLREEDDTLIVVMPSAEEIAAANAGRDQ